MLVQKHIVSNACTRSSVVSSDHTAKLLLQYINPRLENLSERKRVKLVAYCGISTDMIATYIFAHSFGSIPTARTAAVTAIILPGILT